MNRILSVILSLIFFQSYDQTTLPEIHIVASGTKTSLRGLSVVNNQVIWVSGSNGTVGLSSDGGKDWKWLVVKGFEHSDFRDIEGFNSTTAVIMAVGSPAYILKTNDAGETWKVVYENKESGMFLDAMEFWNEEAGIVLGDPIDGKFFIARSFDGGNTWKNVPRKYLPNAEKGEACFAASGTNIRALDNDEAVFVSGGIYSNLFIREKKIHIPILQGKETTGANSIAVWDRYRKNGGFNLVVVGGDFNNDTSKVLNCFYSTNRGLTWKQPLIPPFGYRSCVEYLDKKQLICCGPTGVDYTWDDANTWKNISKEGFYVCRIAKIGDAIYLAGSNGRIARVEHKEKK